MADPPEYGSKTGITRGFAGGGEGVRVAGSGYEFLIGAGSDYGKIYGDPGNIVTGVKLGVSGMVHAGGGPVLTDEQLRPLVLEYLGRLLKEHQPPSPTIVKVPHYYQGGVALGAPINRSSGHYDLDLLDMCRSDLSAVARFSARIDYATCHFYAAIDTPSGPGQWLPRQTRHRVVLTPRSWVGRLTASSLARWRHIRNLLVHDWTPSEAVLPLYRTAFDSLCELTPADTQLKALFERNVVRACHELAGHVDLVAEQLEATSRLAETLDADPDAGQGPANANEAAQLATVENELLEKAGERLTLTEAAARLGVSRQALHKKIKSGAALGVMHGEKLVLPAAQFVEGVKGQTIVPHLKEVLALFDESGAGPWSALQFLIETEPSLGAAPLGLLEHGTLAPVIAAARAYLGLDEG